MGETNYIINESALRQLIQSDLEMQFGEKYGDECYSRDFFTEKLSEYPQDVVDKIYNSYVNPGEDIEDDDVQDEIFKDAGMDIMIDLELTKYKKVN